MTFDFDTKASRENIGNAKYNTCPENIREAGIISFGNSEPEYKTAPSVIEAVIKRAENGLMNYTVPDDTYYKPIIDWMASQRGVTLEKEWIVPTLGMSFAFNTCVKAFTAEGDGIIIQPPTFGNYQKAAENHGRHVVFNDLIEKDGCYEMDFDGLEELMSKPENTLMALCNPQNPIGRVWDEATLNKIAALAEKYGVYVYSDEIFAEICYDGITPMYATPERGPHGISATSLGKTFAFTGTNQANIIIPDEVTRKRFLDQRKKDHFGSIDPLLHAAIGGAYSAEGAAWKDAQLEYLKKNIDYINAFMAENFPMVKISPCQGTYVMWMDWRALGLDEDALMDFFINDALFAPDRGTHYGRNHGGYIRMNISSPIADIEACMERLKAAAQKRGFI